MGSSDSLFVWTNFQSIGSSLTCQISSIIYSFILIPKCKAVDEKIAHVLNEELNVRQPDVFTQGSSHLCQQVGEEKNTTMFFQTRSFLKPREWVSILHHCIFNIYYSAWQCFLIHMLVLKSVNFSISFDEENNEDLKCL